MAAPDGAGAPAGWTEVRVDAPAGTEELVAEALRHDEAAPALTDGPADPPPPDDCSAVRTYLPARVDDTATRARLTERVAALAERTGLSELAGLVPEFRPVADVDWANAWKHTWRPFRVGRLCVVPPWRTAALRPTDLALRLAPGGVFGTGRHPSTRTCLRELQSLPVEGARVVDAGTGTGILAVAALLLGARSAYAFDVDPDSEPNARALAADNAVDADAVTFTTGGFEQLGQAGAPVDGLIANIYHDVLQTHASDLAARLRPGGWFLLSGIHRRHRETTRTAVEAAGLAVDRDLRTGNWCTLVGRRA